MLIRTEPELRLHSLAARAYESGRYGLLVAEVREGEGHPAAHPEGRELDAGPGATLGERCAAFALSASVEDYRALVREIRGLLY